jgi:ABC-type branched-subunit amino acid transport system ATPase component
LVLDRVTKHFGGVAALVDVSFKVERGEIVGLIGPNGSGKTTLLNVVNGLERADSGCIMLDGRSIERLAAHEIARAASAAPSRHRSRASRAALTSRARWRPTQGSCCSTSRPPA